MNQTVERLPAFRAPVWLRGGHAQTVYPLLLRHRYAPRLQRQRWETPDGDFIDTDWLPNFPQTPLVVLFHGLEGSARSHYARALMQAVTLHGWNGVIVHFRGCSGEPNRLPRAYHSGDAAEIGWILQRLRHEFSTVPIYAVGVSLGGNALLKWLGTVAEDALNVIDAAAAVCAPLDLRSAGRALELGFNRLYTANFLATLKRSALEKCERFPELLDHDKIIAARTLFEFDDAVTAPLHGYRDADDYWTRASSKPQLAGIRVPTLLLNARNDPFLPASALPSEQEVSSHVLRDYPAEGGHVGFVSGAFPGHLDWLPRRLLHFFTHGN